MHQSNRRIFSLLTCSAIAFLLSACYDSHITGRDDAAHYYLFEDTTTAISAQQVWDQFRLGSIPQYHSNAFNPGFTKSVYWLIVELKKPSMLDVLHIGNGHINLVDFYRISSDTTIKLWATGDYRPFHSRPLPTLDFVFPLDGMHKFYLVKLDKSNSSLQATFRTLPASVFWDETNIDNSIIFLCTGITLLTIVFGLFLAAISRERIYLFYILYIAAGWLWVLSNHGYGYKFFWPDAPWFASRARPFFAMLTCFACIQFIKSYVGIPTHKAWRRAFNVLTWITSLVMVLVFVPINLQWEVFYYLQVIIPVSFGLFIIVSLSYLSLESWRGNTMAMFYLASVTLVLIFSGFQAAYYSGSDLTSSVIERYGIAIGYVIEVIVITFGLAFRFNNYRRERENALIQMNAQQLMHTGTLIAAQHNERKQIADQLHDVAGSWLSSVKLTLSSIRERELVSEKVHEKLQQTERAVTEVAQMVRNLSHAISPIVLEKVGFKKSLETLVRVINSAEKIDVDLLVITIEEDVSAGLDRLTIIYGIIYELINNVIKHAQASHALIQIIEHEETLVVMVEDNGTGLKGDAENPATHGLAAIESKIHYLKGTCQIENLATGGLLVTIEIPK